MDTKASSVKIDKKAKLIGILRILLSILIFGDLIGTSVLSIWLMNQGVNLLHYQILPYWFNFISFVGYMIFIIYNFQQGIREIKNSSLAGQKNLIRKLTLLLSTVFIITILDSSYYVTNSNFSFSMINFSFFINYILLIIVIILSVKDLGYIIKNVKANKNHQ